MFKNVITEEYDNPAYAQSVGKIVNSPMLMLFVDNSSSSAFLLMEATLKTLIALAKCSS